MKDLLDHHNACSGTVVHIVKWNANLQPLWMTKMVCVRDKISNLWSDEMNPQDKCDSNLVLMWENIFSRKNVSVVYLWKGENELTI